MRKVVIVGAGKTGRGFIGRLAADAGNPSAAKRVDIELGTDKKKLITWTATVDFDVVFLT